MAKLRVPELKNANLTIRLAENEAELAAANQLVFDQYTDKGYWEEDETILQKNKYLHSVARTVFVVLDGNRIIGTASIINDSHDGLPADNFQPGVMNYLRAAGEHIAEVSALAIDRQYESERYIALYLFKFVYQYSFYYAGIDRFVVVSTPKHAFFYERVCRFEKAASSQVYSYVNVDAQLLTVHLLRAHKLFADVYEPSAADPDSFYRFLLVNGHPNLRFPDREMVRARAVDWLAEARLMELPIAV